MDADARQRLAASIVARATDAGLTIATAESCTGGLVASALTDVAGSSAVFGTGFVTYSNDAKARLLAVPTALLERHGAVSREVAEAMAVGARQVARSDIAVSITGIAGPGGGSENKPVGLVHFACASRLGTVYAEHRFGPIGRGEVRIASVAAALEMLGAALDRLLQADTE
ncbi:CinA family protein [Aureimonas sp. AU22]|uniref:CinA family protein n=1 Tax=Aureimonas sp. AU22 TaxID=1638162 RepID=UPI000705B6D9|nr:CinA family protein [Aureimonas sp. AU22]BAT30027.1 damage inducible protein CinA [Aureimonas sp. AU22]